MAMVQFSSRRSMACSKFLNDHQPAPVFCFLFGWLASLAVASLLVTFGCLVANRTSSLRGPQCLCGKKKKLTAMVSQRLVQMIFQLGSCCLGCGLIGGAWGQFVGPREMQAGASARESPGLVSFCWLQLVGCLFQINCLGAPFLWGTPTGVWANHCQDPKQSRHPGSLQ